MRLVRASLPEGDGLMLAIRLEPKFRGRRADPHYARAFSFVPALSLSDEKIEDRRPVRNSLARRSVLRLILAAEHFRLAR